MRKRRVMGAYAPPARPTRMVIGLGLVLLALIVVSLGLAIDPFLAPLFTAG